MRGAIVGAMLAAAAALAPLAAQGASSGAVTAQVVAGGSPCITISSPSNLPVDFGSLAFSATPGASQGTGNPDITVASCATSSESLLASGTNATSGNVTWTLAGTLANTCQNALNQYRLALRDQNQADLFLTTTNQSAGTLAANGTLTRTPRITMPCTGSVGGGLTMTMSFNFVATVP
jgi:hypothetical protein